MTTKKIIDIEVSDASFKRFLDLFKDYSDKVDELPAAWKKLDEAMNGAGKTFEKAAGGTHDALALAATSTALIIEALENAAKSQRQLGQATGDTARGMKNLAGAAKEAGEHIGSIARTLLKIGTMGGVGTALAGLGGGLGVLELAGSATAQQRTARGLGLTPGQVSAFQANLGPYVGSSVLSGAAGAQVDLTKQGLLASLGISPGMAQTETAAEVANQEIAAVRRAWQQTHNLNTAQAQAALQLGFTPGDIRNVGSANAADLVGRQRAAISDAGRLGFSDRVGRDWATLDTALHKAGISIESAFITGLAPLAPGLEKLSEEVSGFIAAFMKNDAAAVVDEVGKGLKWLGDYVGSPNFQDDFNTFGALVRELPSDLRELTGEVKAAAAALAVIAGANAVGRVAGLGGALAGGAIGLAGAAAVDAAGLADIWKHSAVAENEGTGLTRKVFEREAPNAAAVAVMMRQAGAPPSFIAAALGNAAVESGINPQQQQIGGGPGFGLFQWSKERQQLFKQMEGSDIQDASLTQETDFFLKEMRAKYPDTYAALMSGKLDTAQATRLFMQSYLRPADANDPQGSIVQRTGAANQFSAALQQFGALPRDTQAAGAQPSDNAAGRPDPAIQRIIDRLTAAKPVAVTITNHTNARVAVSANAAAQ